MSNFSSTEKDHCAQYVELLSEKLQSIRKSKLSKISKECSFHLNGVNWIMFSYIWYFIGFLLLTHKEIYEPIWYLTRVILSPKMWERKNYYLHFGFLELNFEICFDVLEGCWFVTKIEENHTVEWEWYALILLSHAFNYLITDFKRLSHMLSVACFIRQAKKCDISSDSKK